MGAGANNPGLFFMAFKKRESSERRIHAFIATPAYDGKVDVDYSQSLAETCRDAALYGIQCTAAVMGNGAFIDLARNIFVRLFLEKPEYTHLFFIDSDLKWESRAFISLLAADKPVCAGAYRKRQEPEEYPLRWVADPKEGGFLMRDQWIMCDRVATGFLCIERSVIEKMVAKAPVIVDKSANGHAQPDTPRLFYTYLQDDGRFVGEDFAWCKDYVEQFSEYIWVWPDFDFTHKKYEGNYHNFLIREAEAKLKQAGVCHHCGEKECKPECQNKETRSAA